MLSELKLTNLQETRIRLRVTSNILLFKYEHESKVVLNHRFIPIQYELNHRFIPIQYELNYGSLM